MTTMMTMVMVIAVGNGGNDDVNNDDDYTFSLFYFRRLHSTFTAPKPNFLMTL